MDYQAVAIITARGGSKRIPRKNIKHFEGQPIIKYSIDEALKAKCFDEVMVSTEDKEIAEISSSFGAQIPFFRSEKMAGDQASIPDVIEEVLLEYQKLGKNFKFACCMFATAPLISSKKLEEGFELIKNTDADIAMSVARYSSPIEWAMHIDGSRIKAIWPEKLYEMSQNFKPAYYDAGQFYWLSVDKFLKHKKFFYGEIVPVIISETEVQDIDTEEDWKMAEFKYRIIKGNNHVKSI